MQKKRLSFWQILTMNFGFFGVQFSFGLQQSNMSAIYKYLGAEESELPILWLAGPVTGLIVQPIVGAISDGTWSPKFGRRKPFFLVGAIICEVCGTMLLPVTQNFTKLTPTVFLAFFYLSAFYLLTFVVDKLPIAIVYGTWSGLGIFTIAILSYIFFKQTLAWQAIVGLFLIVIGVILVNSFTGKLS